MSEKYIDLADRIKRGHGDDEVREGIDYALHWLDAHPDQVPGQTITESEFREACEYEDQAHRASSPHTYAERVMFALGITVVPDPEPEFDSETAEALTAAVWGLPLPSEAGEAGRAIARELKKAGKRIVEAGGDDER